MCWGLFTRGRCKFWMDNSEDPRSRSRSYTRDANILEDRTEIDIRLHTWVAVEKAPA